MSNTRFALIRHGQTDWNRYGLMQGRTDIPLNETGRAQALEAAQALAALGERWRMTVSGPLSRVRETASIIAGYLGLPEGATHPDLTEISYGVAEGLLISEVLERWPDGDIPDQEPDAEIGPRGLRALESLRQQYTGGNLIVITHGGLIQATLAHLSGKPLDSFPEVPNASVSLIEHGEEGWHIRMVCGSAFEPELVV